MKLQLALTQSHELALQLGLEQRLLAEQVPAPVHEGGASMLASAKLRRV